MLFDGRQLVGNGPDTNALDVACVVTRAARVRILAARDASIGEERKERGRHVFGIQAFDDVVAVHLDFDEVQHLALEGSKKFIE